MRHAYVAAVSYVDAQIGKVLTAIEASDAKGNTIVILWGDHGWHLGEKTIWGKHTLYERALKSPLIVKLPGGKGKAFDQIVETVDIYPTLMELTDFEQSPLLSGESLLNVIDPNRERVNKVARSFFTNNGVTIRDQRYRIIVHGENYSKDVELYDNQIDPLETINIAAENEKVGWPLFESAVDIIYFKRLGYKQQTKTSILKFLLGANLFTPKHGITQRMIRLQNVTIMAAELIIFFSPSQ
ncbi:sulfatase-like hydrolase/transferase [uncultured Paraglaciecola sp.]|uniref:sulfatase-like hydrolase/transferase n=1 Tax=uncultured Paraglaciecola sp. TaxID=1765024 RepID=UPI0030D895F9|tara:strand:+ start:66747 stop:67469 length:723 start_codon:yes stop_codon:yes gene_type:complete